MGNDRAPSAAYLYFARWKPLLLGVAIGFALVAAFWLGHWTHLPGDTP